VLLFHSVWRTAVWAWVPLLLCEGCGQPETPASVPDLGLHPAATAERVPRTTLTLVPAGSHGPYLGLGDDAPLLVWSVVADAAGALPGWFARPTDSRGEPHAPAQRVADAPSDPQLVRVRSDGSSHLVMASYVKEAGWAIQTLLLDSDGVLKGGPVEITQTLREVVWLDVVATPSGYLAFWAERTGSAGELFAMALDPSGQARTPHTRLHGAALAWQVAPSLPGALLALVTDQHGLEMLLVDTDANVSKENTVPQSEYVGEDVDLIASGPGFLAAYSDRDGVERHVFIVTLGPDGDLLEAPRQLVPPRGDQLVERWVSDSSGQLYLAWREPTQRPGKLLVAPLGAAGVVTATALELPWSADRPPELAARKGQLHSLLWGCVERPRCMEPVVPYSLIFDPDLQPAGAMAWRVADKPADLVWDLRCTEHACYALAALFGSPSSVRLRAVHVGRRPLALPSLYPTGTSPRSLSVRAILDTPPLADFSGIEAGAGMVLAQVSDFDPNTPYEMRQTPAPDGRKAPLRARLSTSLVQFGAPGEPLESSEQSGAIISYRARSVSGVALAHRHSTSLLVWSALDQRRPQVFTTLLDRRGTKLEQAMLTRAPGEVRDVSAASWSRGWAAAWIDERTGTPQAYVAKLGPRLRRLSSDTLLSTGGAATLSVDVRSQGDELLLLTASGHAGGALIQMHRVNVRNMRAVSEATVLAEVDAPVSSVRFATGSPRAVVWTRQGPKPAAEVVLLNEQLSPISRREWLPDAVSGAAQCDSRSCRLAGAAVTEGSQGAVLFGLRESLLPAAERNAAKPLARFADARAARLSPVVEPAGVWFYDATEAGRGRLHHVQVAW
jgi:hypothetical protein